MLRRIAAATGMVAMLVAASGPRAHAEEGSERFTFELAGESWTDVWGERRLELVLHDWSTDDTRDRLTAAVGEHGDAAITTVLRTLPVIGTVNWPGNLTYSVRYARRVARDDGGEDIVFIADRRAWTWWDTNLSTAAGDQQYTVFQIRLDANGQGVGKASVAGPIGSDSDAGVALAEFGTQQALMTDVRRERS